MKVVKDEDWGFHLSELGGCGCGGGTVKVYTRRFEEVYGKEFEELPKVVKIWTIFLPVSVHLIFLFFFFASFLPFSSTYHTYCN